jgi:methionyl aminopeptidase
VIHLKNDRELSCMREAGRATARVLSHLETLIEPGITTLELDREAANLIQKLGGKASFLRYGDPPYPGSICISIDEEVVHGIPSSERQLEEGQIVSIDVGVKLQGFHGDAARTFPVGRISEEKRRLIEVTEQSFWQAFELAKPGGRIGDLSAAVQEYCESNGFGVVRVLTGHGIGKHLHEPPDVPNFGRAGRGIRLSAGMTLAVEPMITLGDFRVRMLSDGWTFVTVDGSPAAHYENTLAVTEDGPICLTAL